MLSTPSGRPPKPFAEWALAAARSLDATLTAPRPDDATEPGSLSEAVALLLSPRVLGPGEGTPEGYPGIYAQGGGYTFAGEDLFALYDAAFGPPVSSPDPSFRIHVLVNHDRDAPPALEAVGLLVGEQKDRLVFSEPGLPLPEISCTTRADLQRLHERVLAAGRRV